MTNTLLTPQVIAREGLMILTANLVAANLVYRDYEREWAGAKVGDTVTIRKPATFVANEFTTDVTVQNITEGSIGLTLEKHYDVTVNVTARDWTLELDDFAGRVVRPAMIAIAQAVDTYVLGKASQIPYFVGTAGSPPDSLEDLALIDQALNEQLVPVADRRAIISPKAKAKMLSIPAVVQAGLRGDEGTALREASMGRIMGVDWYMSQNVGKHTSGTAATPTVTADLTAGASTMGVTTTGTLTLKSGDVFSFAGVTDPVTGETMCFTITADNAASGGAMTNVAFSPPIPVNVSSTTGITLIGSHAMNIAFHPNAFALAIVPLELPRGAANAAYISDGGVGIRVVYGYDVNKKTDTVSFDVLCGAKAIQPQLALRVLG